MAKRGELAQVRVQEQVGRIVELEGELKSRRKELAFDVGNRVISMLNVVFEGGDFPDEIRELVHHGNLSPHDGHDYVGKLLHPSARDGISYKSTDTFAQARLISDISLATIHLLGGSVSQEIFETVLNEQPLGIAQEDLGVLPSAVDWSHDQDTGNVLVLRYREE